jgi:hypothetical protein
MSDPPATISAMESSRSGYVARTGSGRAVRLPIGQRQFTSLLCYLDEVLALQGCDNTLHHAEGWARAHGVAWGRLARSLRGLGGFCDCEVGMNVAYDGDEEVWPP